MKNKYFIYILLAFVVLVTACESSRPGYVLSSGDMEEVLYDIHRAHFLPETMDKSRDDGALQYALMLNVLKQHDVTQAEWDSSMVYYTRHADELQEIYGSLMDRLEYEATALGASIGNGTDTTDVWNGERHILLTSDNLNNIYQWKLDCDTLLEKGEKVTLRFQGLFLNPESQSRAATVLAMRLKNDSVIVRQQTISQTAIYTVDLEDRDTIGIKSVYGMFIITGSGQPTFSMMEQDRPSNNNGQQIFSISNIMLMHEKKEKPVPVSTNADGTNGISVPQPVPTESDNTAGSSPQPSPPHHVLPLQTKDLESR